MKYIDADKLKAHIQHLIKKDNYELFDVPELLSFIDSLQQDDAQVDKMLCSQIWWEEQGWLMIPPDATIEGIDSLLKQVRRKLQQKQPEVDLDFQAFAKEMDAVFNLSKDVTENTEENPLNWEYAIARHFYELGLNARKV